MKTASSRGYEARMTRQIERAIQTQLQRGPTGRLRLAPRAPHAFVNAADVEGAIHPQPSSESGLQKNEIYFCNASSGRFQETYFDEPLTNYLLGWRDPNNIEESVQMIAPSVEVNRRFSFKAAENAEEFLSEVYDDQRAIGADFKRVIYSGEEVHSMTMNRGLMIVCDLDDVPDADKEVGADGVPAWQGQKVAKLTRRLWRNSFRRAITALNASAVQIPVTWDKTAGVNPDLDVRLGLVAMTNVSGIRPNRVVYGDTAFEYRLQTYGSQNNPAGYMGYNAGAEASMAAALGVDKVKICRERYQSAQAAKSEILGVNAYAYFAQDDVDTEDPTNVKRFVSTFSKEQGGGLFRVYIQQLSSKLVAISVEFYEQTVVTYTGGIAQFAITGPQ
jgi:hypothetical protein